MAQLMSPPLGEVHQPPFSCPQPVLRRCSASWALYSCVTGRAPSDRLPGEGNKRCLRLRGRGTHTWLAGIAAFISLTRGDAGDTDAWALGAPDRTAAVPYGFACAAEFCPDATTIAAKNRTKLIGHTLPPASRQSKSCPTRGAPPNFGR